MIEVDLYVFDDEKLIRSALKPINHHIMYNIYHIYLCHFLCHATFMPFFVPYDYKKIISHYEKKNILSMTRMNSFKKINQGRYTMYIGINLPKFK